MKVDLHPEESLDRARAGELGTEERLRLDEHSRACVACAFERRASADFADLFGSFAGDDTIVERLVENTLNPPRKSRTSIRRVSLPPRARGRWSRFLLIAAAAMIAGIAAAAAYSVIARRFAAKPTPIAPPPTSVHEKAAPAPPAVVPSGTATFDVEPAPIIGSAARPVPAPSASSAESGLDAAELFARGNKARRGGSYAEAVRHYSELQKRFPSSREAHTSQVALGWLMLNQLGNSSAALGQFNGYLASGGVLSEEASAGRALALGRLGRSGEERRAWQELLDRYPQSVHAERARQRLQELK